MKYAGLLHKLKPHGTSSRNLRLIFLFLFLCVRRLPVVLYGKILKEYLVNAGVPQVTILSLSFFVPYIMIFLMI